ncbi:MAG: tetratricopeptide repeat protein [Tranquillimonas sp.]
MQRILLRTAAIAALFAAAGAAVRAEPNSGAYLAARHAAIFSDYGKAAEYYRQALAADPGNTALMDDSVTALVGLGDVDAAAQMARRLAEVGAGSQIRTMVRIAADAKAGDWAAIRAELDGGATVGPLFDGLVAGWALIGEGDVSEALTKFDAVAATQGVMAFGLYHKALALASVGDYEGADAILSSDENGGLRLTRRGVVAHAQILSQLDRNPDAVALLDASFGSDPDASLAALRARLSAGETVAFEAVRGAADGVAETLHSIATALNGEASPSYTILYARLTEYLRPAHVEATLMTAGLLEEMERYDLAIAEYRKIPREDPAFDAAELGRAEALRRSGKVDAAIEVMQQLIERNPQSEVFHVQLGDTLRGLDRYAEADTAYSQAVDLFDQDQEGQWIVYFARGIARERLDRWDEAEADFRKALGLNPGQPQVLNYLGYSYLEKGQNLDEALSMIEEAVAARPDSGYITDSLGWALYRLGRYQEAVAPMEKAAELMPVDPVVNDHLGDVYWAVGRKLEAEFQWKRALSFVPNGDGEADPDRIRRKLEVGLDRVLSEEGKAPLALAHDG